MDHKEVNTTCQDSGCGSLESSLYFNASSPSNFSTPNYINSSRKRKLIRVEEVRNRRLVELESSPATPQASSTLNESLICNLERFRIIDKTVDETAEDSEEPSNKFVKSNENVRIHSTPNTPQKQACSVDSRPGSSCFSASKNLNAITESPMKEKHDILYPSLKPVSVKKPLSPEKFDVKINKKNSPTKRRLFNNKKQTDTLRSMSKVLNNSVIMEHIFQYLSDGELYRFRQAFEGFSKAVECDKAAHARFLNFKEKHKENKENYKITPPSSPQKDDTPPVSPGSKHFYNFLNVAKNLDTHQTQMKCPRCNGPSIVTNNLAQCNNINSCGYIYCKLCGSYSCTGPENFVDKCGRNLLLSEPKPKLNDLSNLNYSLLVSPNLSGNWSPNDTSGFYSETGTPLTAKKNRSYFLGDCNKSKALSVNNRLSVSGQKKPRRQSSIVPVLQDDSKLFSVFESPPSPPKIREHSACSKASKRNLKRLTR